MTRDDLELLIRRELAAMVNEGEAINAILEAADAYAQTECENAIGAAT